MSDRVLFQDVIPYDVPAALAELHGPASGSIVLPHSIYWGPEPAMDLDLVLIAWSMQLQTREPGERPTLSKTLDAAPTVERYRSESAHSRDAVRNPLRHSVNPSDYQPPAAGENRTMGYGR